MELVPYLICLAVGFAAGIWFEWRYGARVVADAAAIKAILNPPPPPTPPSA